MADVHGGIPAPPKKLSYRQRLKLSNPTKYQEYLSLQKERSVVYRIELKKISQKRCPTVSEREKLQKHRDVTKKRAARYRERIKTSKTATSRIKKPNSKPKEPITRKKREIQRENWKIAKRNYRVKLSGAKKRWVKEKDKEKKRQIRASKIARRLLLSPSAFRSKQILYNAASSVRKVLPKSPNKFAEVISHITSTAPILRTRLLGLPSRASNVTSLKKKKALMAKKLLTKSLMNVRKRKKRIDAMSSTFVKRIHDFYHSISRPLPNKRYATKHGPAYVLQMSLMSAYKQFRLDHPDIAVKFTKFSSLRPKNVRLLTSSHWEFCVCTVCMNITYKIQTLNAIATKHKKPELKINNGITGMINLLLCPVSDNARFHKYECIYGDCKTCKNYAKTIRSHFKELEIYDSLSVCHHWERREEEDGKSRKRLMTRKLGVSQILTELIKDIESPIQGNTLFKHVFQGNWQQMQFNKLKTNLPDDCVLMVLDFGKNRVIRNQDQAKCDYFCATQVTVHPVVMYYKSPTVPGLTIRDSMMFLSNDLKHDHYAAHHCLNKAIEYLQRSISFSKVLAFSDGCAAQYKGKNALAQISKHSTPIEWNYFGSDHGKGDADGELGILNRSLDKAILGRKVILSNGKDMTEWCNNTLKFDESGSKRHFHYYESISRDDNEVKPLPGIRNLHQVKNIKPYLVDVRRLSCYCKMCITQLPGCCNEEYVGKSSRKQLCINKKGLIEPQPTSYPPETYFTDVREDMIACSTFAELKTLVSSHWDSMPPLLGNQDSPTFVGNNLVMDKASLPLVPVELTSQGLYPAIIYGDGNCLPRCASVIAYGTENNHEELRTRIVLELVHNEDKYLTDRNLRKGSTVSNITKQICMLSDEYTGQSLNKKTIKSIFEAGVLKVCRSGTYMSLWDLAAAANVLSMELVSVYPDYGARLLRKHADRTFYPFAEKEDMTKVYIMWTNIRGNLIPESDWEPNHFVVLLKTHHTTEQESSTSAENVLDVVFDSDNDDVFPELNASILSFIGHLDDDTVTDDDTVRLWVFKAMNTSLNTWRKSITMYTSGHRKKIFPLSH